MQAVAQYELEHYMPTVKSIAEIMRKLGDEPAQPQGPDVGFIAPPSHAVSFQDVLEGVSRYYSVSVPDMLGQSRVREVLIPRHIAMYIGKKHLRMSFVRLGESFSNRDHTTVMHAVEKIENKITEDPQLMREVRTLEREVGLVTR